jgi:hypothetical protein
MKYTGATSPPMATADPAAQAGESPGPVRVDQSHPRAQPGTHEGHAVTFLTPISVFY